MTKFQIYDIFSMPVQNITSWKLNRDINWLLIATFTVSYGKCGITCTIKEIGDFFFEICFHLRELPLFC